MPMKIAGFILVLVVTAGLIVIGLAGPGRGAGTLGVASGSAVPGLTPAAATPEQAITNLLGNVQRREWQGAYAQLANSSEVDQTQFTKELAGRDGSIRSLSTLQSWELHPLHETNNDAQIRTTMHWSTAVGQVDDVRDLNVVHRQGTWKVAWAPPHFPNIPAQIIPVNYLRWDFVTPEADEDEWGGRNVDAPRVRIISMNAVDYRAGSVVMGEVVNEDTIPAFVNVNAVLIDQNGKAIDEESSFDKIAHVLLPKQVSPYRIDFPHVGLQDVKNVQMDVKATLVPASADPVIGVMDQKKETNALGGDVLRGTLLNESGQIVNVPHVIATFYDNNGKVIWVSDGYVDQALYPQTPEPFAVQIPRAVADKVQNYHVVVNQYSITKQ
jgi:hypothetical protein